MIELHYNGDNFLSQFNIRLWNFTYTVLLKFNCPIQFKVIGPDVARKLDQYISFFVPEGRYDVVNYIRQEWYDEITHNENVSDKPWFWSTKIDIYYFKGSELYTEREYINSMVENMSLYLTAYTKDKNVNIKDFTEKKH